MGDTLNQEKGRFRNPSLKAIIVNFRLKAGLFFHGSDDASPRRNQILLTEGDAKEKELRRVMTGPMVYKYMITASNKDLSISITRSDITRLIRCLDN
jgi:hypothetical protein